MMDNSFNPAWVVHYHSLAHARLFCNGHGLL